MSELGPGVTMQGKLEAESIRLLRDGATASQVRDRTGIPLDRLRELVAEMPGRAAAVAQPGRCEHITTLAVQGLLEHPANVRTGLGDAEQLRELEQSILAHGVLQPLVVMKRDGRWVLLAGHRRLAAARAAGLVRVPVVVQATASDAQSIEKMLVENLQRADLDPLDEARAYGYLLEHGRTQGQIARAVGKSQGHISQRLALLNLTDDELQLLRDKGMTLGEAYRAGRDRSPRRRPNDTSRPKPKRVAHFHAAHPLADAARGLCMAAGHPTGGKLGPACGRCWEAAIRADARARGDLT